MRVKSAIFQHQGCRPRVDRGAAGAFQQFAGGQRIIALAEEHHIRGTEPAEIVAEATTSGGSEEAFLTELGSRIAIGAAAVATLLDPGLIILGGPVDQAGGARLLGLVTTYLGRLAFVRPPPELSTTGDGGVLAGALEGALQDVRSRLAGIPWWPS
ncbi:MAG: ROK family protein [Nakamurella sp.]